MQSSFSDLPDSDFVGFHSDNSCWSKKLNFPSNGGFKFHPNNEIVVFWTNISLEEYKQNKLIYFRWW